MVFQETTVWYSLHPHGHHKEDLLSHTEPLSYLKAQPKDTSQPSPPVSQEMSREPRKQTEESRLGVLREEQMQKRRLGGVQP